jgi:glutamyl/glutaminyl-tRNA synthetase
MVSYSENQKKLASRLVHEPQTLEELSKSTGLSLDAVQQDIKAMLALKVIEKLDGFPTRYALKKDISEEVERRKQLAENDKNKLKLHAIIETQSVEPELLKKQSTKLGESMQNEKDFLVYSLSHAPTMKQEEMYSSFIDVTMSVKDFKALVKFVHYYGPTTIEVLKPAKLEVDAHDLQEGLLDMAQMVHRYSDLLTKLLNRKELEEFNKRLIK